MEMNPNPSSAGAQPRATPRPVVLFLLDDLARSRSVMEALDVARFLQRAGGDAIVASGGGPLIHDLERAGIRHLPLPAARANPYSIHKASAHLARAIEDFSVDIVHAWDRLPGWLGFLAAKRTGRAFVTTFHTPHDADWPRRHFFNSILARGDRVMVLSSHLADHAVRQHALPETRLRPVPQGVDLSRFNASTVTAQRMATLSEAWRLPDGRQVILCPGRLLPVKGQLLLLAALAQLPRRDFICVLAGDDTADDAYVETIERRTHELDLAGHVSMVGECGDMPTAYMLADVVAVPHLGASGFARVAAEAQAMGRPVIASDIGAMPDLVRHNETGWLARADDPAQLAATLTHALRLTPEQRLRLGTKAAAHAHAHFSRDEMCWATLDVYQEVYGPAAPWTGLENAPAAL